MANLYAKIAGGNWSAAGTWSNTSSAGVDNSGPPTSSTDVIFELASGNVTIDASASCQSLDTTSGTGSYSGTIVHNTGITLTIGGSSVGANNVSLKFNSGMTYTPADNTSLIVFATTQSTVQSITTAGKLIGNITISGALGAWSFLDSLNLLASTTTLTHTAGTLHWDGASDNSGLIHNIGVFTGSGSTTRMDNLGNATINISGSGVLAWSYNISTGLTLISGTSTINLNGTNCSINGGNNTFYTINILGGSNPQIATNGFTAFNLSVLGSAIKTESISIAANITVMGTFTLTGNSVVNRLLITSNTLGTQRIITNDGAAMVWRNVDFRYIRLTSSFDASSILGNSGDCLGNSNITFTSPSTQTWNGTSGGNWSTNAWTNRVPLPQDNVIMGISFINGQTITQDMARIGRSINWTGASGNPTWVTNVIAQTIYGSLTLISGMIFTTGSPGTWTFEGNSSHILMSAGKSFAVSMTIQMLGGTLSLLDAFSQTTGSLTFLIGGTFITNGFSITTNVVTSNTGATHTINFSNSIWTMTGTGNVLSSGGGLVIISKGSTIVISDVGSTSKTFNGGGLIYNNLQITGGGSGAVIIAGANTFNSIKVIGGTKSITLPGSTTTTLLSGEDLGNGSNVITFISSAGSSTLSQSSGLIDWNFLNLTNIIGTGGAQFYAGANSTDGGGNTGWIFSSPPIPLEIITGRRGRLRSRI